MPSLAVIIPVYNEGKNIRPVLQGLHAAVSEPFQVLVVYDFDEDDTLPVARELAQQLGLDLHLVKNRFGRGALNAIKTGLLESESDYMIVTMADLSDPPEVINALLAKARQDKADLVCASRYMRGGRQSGGPLLKKLLSRAAGVSLYYLTSLPTHDVTNSFKLYSRDVIRSVPIASEGGFELGMELTIKAHYSGFKVAEVPTHWTDRTDGESRFRLFQWLPHYLRWYFLALRLEVGRRLGLGHGPR
jgi:glycosyltransferase involved in cell wall biosynthesis